ncbi:MAG TPA: FMN-binding protein [Clostridia bacterium]|nr:FMN-binding protein [Clostridia bacterium]
MKNAIKLILTLGLIAAISGGGLGAFYSFTMPIVEARQMEEMISKGFKEVLPAAQRFQAVEAQGELPAGVTQVYEGLDENNRRIGIAYEAVGTGYGGEMKIAVGIDLSTNSLAGIKVLSHGETPGLGSRIETDEAFLSQFPGKPVGDPFAVGQDVDGITGATVSSVAVTATVGTTVQQVLAYVGEE